jgi:septation ring formation regulator EzrA
MLGRKKLDPDRMKSAVQAVSNKEMRRFKAAKIFSVPLTVLKRYFNDSEKNVEDVVNTKLGRKPLPAKELTDRLSEYCILVEEKIFRFVSERPLPVGFLTGETKRH